MDSRDAPDTPEALSHRQIITERYINEYLAREFGNIEARLLTEQQVVDVKKLLEQDARAPWL